MASWAAAARRGGVNRGRFWGRTQPLGRGCWRLCPSDQVSWLSAARWFVPLGVRDPVTAHGPAHAGHCEPGASCRLQARHPRKCQPCFAEPRRAPLSLGQTCLVPDRQTRGFGGCSGGSSAGDGAFSLPAGPRPGEAAASGSTSRQRRTSPSPLKSPAPPPSRSPTCLPTRRANVPNTSWS